LDFRADGRFAIAAGLIIAFLFIERRHPDPLSAADLLQPQSRRRRPTLPLVAAASSGCSSSARSLQQVLGYSALKTRSRICR
jgi:hypothetical protein